MVRLIIINFRMRLFMILSLLLAACQGAIPGVTTPTLPATSSPEPGVPRTLVYCTRADPGS